MPNPIIHWEIAGKDGAKSQKFFSDLFGWKINADNPMNYGTVDTQTEDGINGGILTAPKGVPFLTIYVRVDHIPSYLQKAEELGGKTVVPASDIPGIGQYAFFKDPDGNIVGLFKELDEQG